MFKALYQTPQISNKAMVFSLYRQIYRYKYIDIERYGWCYILNVGFIFKIDLRPGQMNHVASNNVIHYFKISNISDFPQQPVTGIFPLIENYIFYYFICRCHWIKIRDLFFLIWKSLVFYKFPHFSCLQKNTQPNLLLEKDLKLPYSQM